MIITRIEYDISTGNKSTIDQLAYKNADGDILVIDAIDQPPEGYEPFDPYAVELTE